MTKKDLLTETIAAIRAFRFCEPGGDGDEVTAVTVGYHMLVVQIKALATPLLPPEEAARLNSINVDMYDIYSAYHASAELRALLPDIEAALEGTDESALPVGGSAWFIDPALIVRLEATESRQMDVTFLVRMCREINACFAHGHILATLYLTRAVLNYVPPVFGREAFSQVVANATGSLKASFEHLETGLRKIADFQTHRRMAATSLYPSGHS